MGEMERLGESMYIRVATTADGGQEAISDLPMSYAAWRAARSAAPPITIAVTATGRPLKVDDASHETIRRIVETLRAASGSDRTEGPEQAGAGAGSSQ
ncbi:hypothetical protein [Streptomyces sp. NPDC058683]|uniref:effector-associated constant component EACC1 n=1 Tax=Streptomyces sp. NPDC058683 TaxID=3346597 RepID=UPI0036574020